MIEECRGSGALLNLIIQGASFEGMPAAKNPSLARKPGKFPRLVAPEEFAQTLLYYYIFVLRFKVNTQISSIVLW